MRFVAAKGSVTLDGVSLTVNDVDDAGFTVNIIPHTGEVTTLGALREGGEVNIEVDLVAALSCAPVRAPGPARMNEPASPVEPLQPPPRVLLVVSRYYAEIAGELERGARAAIEAAGGVVELAEAPGAFEIPAVIARIAASARPCDGYVALGCVIRGETTHYDYVCGETARALMDLSITPGLAIGFGVLTVENADQARVRAGVEDGDKGGEAARACLAMIAHGRAAAGGRR